MSENKEGRNLEEINKKRILNFGDLSLAQVNRGIKDASWNKSWVKCERCNEQVMAEWEGKDKGWNIGNWKVYLRKAQVKKSDTGYFIVGG